MQIFSCGNIPRSSSTTQSEDENRLEFPITDHTLLPTLLLHAEGVVDTALMVSLSDSRTSDLKSRIIHLEGSYRSSKEPGGADGGQICRAGGPSGELGGEVSGPALVHRPCWALGITFQSVLPLCLCPSLLSL